MKLSLEKETFMTDLISGCIKSFSLVSFNQMSWSMNKKHTGKKWWNLWWTYPHGGTIDVNAWEKEYFPEFYAKLKRAFIKALYEVKNSASQIAAVFRKSQQSRTLQFVFFLKCRLKMFVIIHNVAQPSNKFNPGHQGSLMGFFSSSVHFDLVGRLIWVSQLLLCACKTRDRDDFQSGYSAWFYVRVMVEVSVNFFFWMCPKRSDYTNMYRIFSISHNVLISQRLTRNADGSDKALYERCLKELAMLLHLNEQIITRLHKTH